MRTNTNPQPIEKKAPPPATPVDNFKEAIDKILIADFFFVLIIMGWLGVAVRPPPFFPLHPLSLKRYFIQTTKSSFYNAHTYRWPRTSPTLKYTRRGRPYGPRYSSPPSESSWPGRSGRESSDTSRKTCSETRKTEVMRCRSSSTKSKFAIRRSLNCNCNFKFNSNSKFNSEFRTVTEFVSGPSDNDLNSFTAKLNGH